MPSRTRVFKNPPVAEVGLGGQGSVLAAAKQNPEDAPHLNGKEIKRIVYVQGKIQNIVVG